jgi:hypothetical protein
LGAVTRTVSPDTLEARGLVERLDLTPPFKYRITHKGRAEIHSVLESPQPLVKRRINVESFDLDDRQLEIAIEESALLFPSGVPASDTVAITRQRRGQDALRRLTLRNYGSRCAVCDVEDTRLLRASHIIPWALREETRGELDNVICLCAIHDVLFELGYWTLDAQLKVLRRGGRLPKTLQLALPSTMTFRPPLAHVPNALYTEYHRQRHAGA